MSARVTVVERSGERPLSKRIFVDGAGKLDDELGRVAVSEILADPRGTAARPRPTRWRAAPTASARPRSSTPRRVRSGRPSSLVIHSFAHGGMTYRLRHDVAAVEAAMAKAAREAADVLAPLLPQVHELDPVDRERLRDAAANAAGVGKRAVDRLLEESFRRQAAQDAERRAEREAAR
jgi:hypothetical protein